MHSIHQNKWQLWTGFHCHRKQMKISKLAFLDWFLYMQYQLKTHPILEDGKVNTPSTFCEASLSWIMERMFYTDEYSFSLWKRQWMNNPSLSFIQCQTEHLEESFMQQGFMGRKHLLTFFFFNVWESFYILAYFLSQKLVTW